MTSSQGLSPPLKVGQAQVYHLVHTARMQQVQSPDDHRVPVVAEEDRIFVPVVIEKGDEMTRQVFDAAVRHSDRTGRVAATPVVRGDDVVARRDEGGHLITPRESKLRPAVTEHDGLSSILPTCFEDFEFHTVRPNQGRARKIGRLEQSISSSSLRGDPPPSATPISCCHCRRNCGQDQSKIGGEPKKCEKIPPVERCGTRAGQESGPGRHQRVARCHDVREAPGKAVCGGFDGRPHHVPCGV